MVAGSSKQPSYQSTAAPSFIKLFPDCCKCLNQFQSSGIVDSDSFFQLNGCFGRETNPQAAIFLMTSFAAIFATLK